MVYDVCGCLVERNERPRAYARLGNRALLDACRVARAAYACLGDTAWCRTVIRARVWTSNVGVGGCGRRQILKKHDKTLPQFAKKRVFFEEHINKQPVFGVLDELYHLQAQTQVRPLDPTALKRRSALKTPLSACAHESVYICMRARVCVCVGDTRCTDVCDCGGFVCLLRRSCQGSMLTAVGTRCPFQHVYSTRFGGYNRLDTEISFGEALARATSEMQKASGTWLKAPPRSLLMPSPYMDEPPPPFSRPV
jgi:hypothetical protein